MTPIKLEDELALSESKWRGRIITLAVLLLGVGTVAVAIYNFAFRSDATTVTRSTEENEIGYQG